MSHIGAGTTRIHDQETTHKKLVSTLRLSQPGDMDGDLKGFKGSDNLLNPVNDIHHSLKNFPNAHSF